MAVSTVPVRTAEELHDGVADVHSKLADLYDDLVEFTQHARMADQGVKPDDLLRVTNALAEARSAAANLIATPQGTDEDTGVPSNTAPVGTTLTDVPPEHNDNQPAAESASDWTGETGKDDTAK